MDIMLDLETLSSAPDAAIVAIGACTMNDGTVEGFVRDTFYRAVDARSAQAMGGRIDGATVAWWLQQPESARKALLDNPVGIERALLDFVAFVRKQGTACRIWGNGANFDNVVIRSALQRYMVEPPWSHRDDRCHRTLKSLRPEIALKPYGTHHNALDDAFAQARHAEAIFATMRSA